MRGRLTLRRTALWLLGFLGVSLLAGVFLAEGTLHPSRRLLTAKDEMQAQEMAKSHEARLTNVAIVASDHATLRAWSIQPRNSNGHAVILLHGLSDNRMGMIGYADLLLGDGFTVLMPDARAHGNSGGQLATYGLLEADDIHRWFEWLQQRQVHGCIFGFGESMGGAQLLQSLNAEPRFCAVAAESAFSSFREIAYDRVGQRFHTGPWLGQVLLRPMIEIAFCYLRWRHKMDLAEVSPREAVARGSIPVLLVHGQNDGNIAIRHSREIAARNSAVVLWEVPGTDHCGAITTAPEEFRRRVLGWFRGNQMRKGM